MGNKIFEARSEIVKALAHEIRLEIVDLLSRKEHCVCELVEKLDASQSTVSKHLGILKKAGIVDSQKNGLNVTYFLETPCIINFFNCIDEVLLKNYKQKEKELELIKKLKEDV
ncbi:MAG: winged helix-turn-helix transcriptional regulator [Candidatus Mcinerneyibacterium aminivorans]|uniref:Winged helix-turn-helix transcriptional regulator n=1 Tax=Candidatus Mcinerneyibacterium aminivorans TaxID=2703815 RepID=A0A5D0MKQ3_9BACT|nr:MAG: winged helix-turn-helix transcriptional regulator [Candidatus Mcinerneyibacterium aminivorans]